MPVGQPLALLAQILVGGGLRLPARLLVGALLAPEVAIAVLAVPALLGAAATVTMAHAQK